MALQHTFRRFWRLILWAGLLWPATGAEPIRVLILTGQTDAAHNWRETTPALRRILASAGRFTVQVNEEPRRLTPASLAGYDLLLVNYNGPRLGADAEKAIEDFLDSGKGLVSFHGVSYGPFMGTEQQPGGWVHRPETAWAAWPRILGAFWAPENIGHSIPHAFRVRVTDRQHPITRDMPPEFTFRDELYHRMSLRPEARVLAVAFNSTAMRGTGRDEPVFWTVAWGKGRAFHTTLGHDAAVICQPGFVTLLTRAAEWAATGAVTLPGWLTLEAHHPPVERPQANVRKRAGQPAGDSTREADPAWPRAR